CRAWSSADESLNWTITTMVIAPRALRGAISFNRIAFSPLREKRDKDGNEPHTSAFCSTLLRQRVGTGLEFGLGQRAAAPAQAQWRRLLPWWPGVQPGWIEPRRHVADPRKLATRTRLRRDRAAGSSGGS